MNVAEVCKHIQTFIDVYEHIEDREKPMQEVKQYLMEKCHKPESTARLHIEAIKKSDAGLLRVKGNKIGLDLDKVKEFERELDEIFHWSEYDDRSGLEDDLNRAIALGNERINQANKAIKEIDDLCMKEILEHQKDVDELEGKIALERLTNQALEEEILAEKATHYVVDTASVKIKESRNSYVDRTILFSDMHPSLDPEKCSLDSYFKELDEKDKLTVVRLKTIVIGRIFSDRILSKIVERIKPLQKLSRRIHPNYGAFTIDELLANEGLSNAEKLSMYALSTRHFSKETKEVLQMAAENGIHAEYVIRILESYVVSRKTKDAFVEALKLATSESECLMRMQFAKELLQKQWCIEAIYNGKKTLFQLVPVEQLEKLHSDIRDLKLRVEKNKI